MTTHLSDNNSSCVGNGRNSRALFQKRELTEFWGKLCEFGEKLGEFALAYKDRLRGTTKLSPRNSVCAKNSLSSVFETVLSETVFGLCLSVGLWTWAFDICVWCEVLIFAEGALLAPLFTKN